MRERSEPVRESTGEQREKWFPRGRGAEKKARVGTEARWREASVFSRVFLCNTCTRVCVPLFVCIYFCFVKRKRQPVQVPRIGRALK